MSDLGGALETIKLFYNNKQQCWITINLVAINDTGTIVILGASAFFCIWGLFEWWRGTMKMRYGRFIRYIFTDFTKQCCVAGWTQFLGFCLQHKPKVQFNFAKKLHFSAASRVNSNILGKGVGTTDITSGGQQLTPEAMAALLGGKKKKKLTKAEKKALKLAKKAAKAKKLPYSVRIQDLKSKVMKLSVALVPQVKGIKLKKKEQDVKEVKEKKKLSLFSKKPKVEKTKTVAATTEAPKQEKVKKEGMFGKLKPKSGSFSSLSYDTFSKEKSKLKMQKEQEKKAKKEKEALLKAAKKKNSAMKDFLAKIKSLTAKKPKAPKVKDSKSSAPSKPSFAAPKTPLKTSSKVNPIKKDEKKSFGGMFGKSKEANKKS
ncbi:hypothetical protein MSUIS_00280 [Mycoplasma suis KI3806]|uniref:Uncharacterized protein n=1 Tax=Mycoplasma suis (strain KI_3806) TaxID=708248 RepID=F0V2P9_MYCS3|nr:hypothetical protein MSUIS_00280 [Mycoplasma suis KI3806]